MLKEEEYEALKDAFDNLADPVSNFLITDIVRRIKESGEYTSTAQYQMGIAKGLRVSKRDFEKFIKKNRANIGEDIEKLLNTVLELVYANTVVPGIDRIDDDLKRVVETFAALCSENYTNATQTLGMIDPYGNPRPLWDAYTSCCDYAFKKVVTGAQSYQEAVMEATKNLTEQGIMVVDYQSGARASLDVAVRRNVFGGMGLMVEKLEKTIHDEIGASGWEISAHEASAKDHEPYQGRQYTNDEYEALNNSLKRRIGTLNCKHIAYPILIGINKPMYTEAELKAMAERNEKGIEYEGKHYTKYEATQMQRAIERTIRKQRRKILALEEMGFDAELKKAKFKNLQLEAKYKDFSQAAHLRTQVQRLRVIGFGPKQYQ